MFRYFIKLMTLVVALFCSNYLGAQTEKISFEKYGVAEGLPEEYVTPMIQDNQGFIWFGTQNGLVKYVGKRDSGTRGLYRQVYW